VMVRVPIFTMQNLGLQSNLNYSTIGAIPENTPTLGSGIARSKHSPLIGTGVSTLGNIFVYVR
jgi:hypothetical protein